MDVKSHTQSCKYCKDSIPTSSLYALSGLEIFKEEKSISQIASEYGIHPNQLIKRKIDAVAVLIKNLASNLSRNERLELIDFESRELPLTVQAELN